jgi:hypothetical protein
MFFARRSRALLHVVDRVSHEAATAREIKLSARTVDWRMPLRAHFFPSEGSDRAFGTDEDAGLGACGATGTRDLPAP